MDEDEQRQTREEFAEAVNMQPAKLERWLETDASKSVGWPKDRGERIVEIKHKHVDELTDDDYAHMRKVIGYVARHSQQRPDGDITDTPWRYSLMNWGHDPLIKD